MNTHELQTQGLIQPYQPNLPRVTAFDLHQAQFSKPYIEALPKGPTKTTHEQQMEWLTRPYLPLSE